MITVPYKDPDKQREAIKLAARKYRRRKREELKQLKCERDFYKGFFDGIMEYTEDAS